MPDFSVRAISISNAFVRVSKVLLVLVLDFPKPERYTPLATVGVPFYGLPWRRGGTDYPYAVGFLRPHISPSDYAICNHWLTLLSGNPTLTCQISVCIVPFHTLPIYDVFALTIRFYRIFHVPACLSWAPFKTLPISPCLLVSHVVLTGESQVSGVLNLHP